MWMPIFLPLPLKLLLIKKTDVEFTLDFTGSVNVFSAMGGLKVTKKLKPGEAAIIQDLGVSDAEKSMQLKYGIQARSYG